MKNHEFGVEPRILTVSQKAPRGVFLEEIKKAAADIYYTIGSIKY